MGKHRQQHRATGGRFTLMYATAAMGVVGALALVVQSADDGPATRVRAVPEIRHAPLPEATNVSAPARGRDQRAGEGPGHTALSPTASPRPAPLLGAGLRPGFGGPVRLAPAPPAGGPQLTTPPRPSGEPAPADSPGPAPGADGGGGTGGAGSAPTSPPSHPSPAPAPSTSPSPSPAPSSGVIGGLLDRLDRLPLLG